MVIVRINFSISKIKKMYGKLLIRNTTKFIIYKFFVHFSKTLKIAQSKHFILNLNIFFVFVLCILLHYNIAKSIKSKSFGDFKGVKRTPTLKAIIHNMKKY